MKTKKAMLILICAVVVGVSAMAASAEERQNEVDQNLQDKTQEPILIAPGPDSTETGSETPLVIAPSPGGNEPVVSSSVAEKNDLVETAGIPILGMTCVIAIVTILIVVIYKRK